ncbi:hypothetical protein F3Y22_tig00111105pilonHSYRG00005 [Hibiscus syriacus]|uniref:Uncharacterized protein n=1 Tax=Hibiscus syriacus TaxID=106335 RepID=A0A6A2YYD0_HIBSY|nr:hypothetical protein F3Y22_tig00111105pilonHSYRG00005 [Hibiscus syriacus]
MYFVLAAILLSFWGFRIEASFTPADNYLIASGSSRNFTFRGRTFVPDSGRSSSSLKSGTSFVTSSDSIHPPPIYQSARVFSGIASYEFDIQREGHPLRRTPLDLALLPPSSEIGAELVDGR